MRNHPASSRIAGALPLAAALLAALLLTSCAGILSVGIEQTPTSDPAPAATLTALQKEVDRLSAALATAVAPPTAVPSTLGRIAYIKGGDLWFVIAPTGPHQRLTIDGYNREPRWSPTGEWLAYRKDRSVLLEREIPCTEPLRQDQPPCKETVSTAQEQVWTMRRTGEASRVINLGLTVRSFAWSPQGDQLAYVSGQGHLQVLDPASEDEYRLVSAENNASVAAIAWSGDGARIAYEWIADENSAEEAASSAGIYVIDAAGGRAMLALHGARARASLAGWADDAVLVWQQPDRATPAGETALLYAVTAPQANGEGAPVPRPVATEPMLPQPDFVAVGATARAPVAFVAGVDLATWTNKRVAAGDFRTPSEVAAISPAWSPDAMRLAYVAMPDAAGLSLGAGAGQALLDRRIWVAAPASGAMRQLTKSEGFRDERPQWSAQGGHLLFARITREGQASLWVISAEGGAPQIIVDELTPAPDPIGAYGFIDWQQHFDWWRG